MSAARLPDFERTAVIAQGNLEASELAECHGIACGLLCRCPEAGMDDFLDLLDMLELVNNPGAALRMALEQLLTASGAQLADEEMSLSLWLPADDETLEDRTMALAQWCSGFLAGVGSGDDEVLEAVSDDSDEGLRDLQHISAADVTDTSESEEDENAFMEIAEYVRVVVLMVREDLRGPDNSDSIH